MKPFLFLLCLTALPLSAQDLPDLEFLGASEGSILALAASEDAVLANAGAYLHVLNPASPGELESVARLWLGTVPLDLLLHESLALVLTRQDLRILDLQSMTDPQEIGRLPLEGSAYRMAAQDSLLLLAGREGVVQVLSLADPASPQLLHSWDEEQMLEDIVLQGRRAALARFDGEVKLLDVSLPADPQLIHVLPSETYASSLALEQDLLFVARFNAGVEVYDLTDPEAPALLSTFAEDNANEDLLVLEDHVVLQSTTHGLSRWDLQDPAAPVLLAQTEAMNRGTRVAVTQGDFLALSEPLGLLRLSLEPNEEPQVHTIFRGGGRAAALHVSGEVLHVASDHHGYRAFADDPQAGLPLLGEFDTDWGVSRSLVVYDNWVYLADWSSNVRVMDATDPANPVQTDLAPGAQMRFLERQGELLIGAGAGEVMTWSLADPAAPELLDRLDVPGSVFGMAVCEDRVFLSNNNAPLYAVDLADPESLSLAGSYEDGQPGCGLACREGLLYQVLSNGTLRVFDVQGAGAPQLRHTQDTAFGGHLLQLDVAGEWLFLGSEDEFLRIYSLADPEAPVLGGALEVPGLAWSSRVVGDRLYVASHVGGVAVWRIGQLTTVDDSLLPQSLALLPNHPNPFNPVTQIRFRLARAGAIELAVYNLQGQRVSLLHSGPQAAGEHSIAFDAAGLASGVYLARLQSGEQSASRRMLLLK